MFENVLTCKGISFRMKITVRLLLLAGIVVLAVLLPQLVHAVAGAEGGVRWLPMYLPVVLGGCILGVRWGIGAGLLAPITSFIITAALGNPMPAAARLPFMILESVAMAAVAGLFSRKIAKNARFAFPAVLAALAGGRILFFFSVAVFQSFTPFTPAAVWGQIQTGLVGLIAQAALLPWAVIAFRRLLRADGNND